MLRFSTRRLLWAIPTLFGISVIVFLLTSLIPEPAGLASPDALLALDPTVYDALEEERRQRFLDLPRFINEHPSDVRTRAEQALDHIAKDDEHALMAAHTLARLGGAALPHVLPKLDRFAPPERTKVALALAPIGERMGVGSPAELRDPQKASAFWTRFWEDRTLDFTEPSVRRTVGRLLRHTSELRERDITEVDTFALSEILLALKELQQQHAGVGDKEAILRLSGLAAHATGRTVDLTDEPQTAETARQIARDWQSWWYVHKSDYVTFVGPERITAAVSETRYGKWLARAVTGQFGISPLDNRPIFDKLVDGAQITFALTGLAMLASYLIALPLALLSAWRHNKPVDRSLALVLFVLYSLPTFWVAEIFVRVMPPGSAGRILWPSAALTVASLASLSRYQRTAMLEVLGLDYVRTARAKGVSEFRVLVMHALRNAMMPTVTLAGLQLPTLIGGAFIVEEVFALPGLGYQSLRAVEGHDNAWLIAMILLAAVVSTVGLIVSDLAYAALDPRVRELFLRREGTHA
ncbi:ABC transporter permease subunit [Pendulispora albinea]|uniref:ABC transporter permease n=1 Tax=Pendulispora albinea TaxID=2741071 RepID=A0ABZ2LQP1_9BACT